MTVGGKTWRSRAVASRWVLALALASLAACSGEQPGRPYPGGRTDASAEITVAGDRTYYGVFVLTVGPGERAWFEFAGDEDPPTTLQRRVQGTFFLDPEDMQRSEEGAWIVYRPTDPWLWIFDNRGTYFTYDTSGGGQGGRIRDFSYHRDAMGRVTVRFVAVSPDRIDADAMRILPGDDQVVDITGVQMGNCRAADEMGRLVDDPMMLLNPFCRELLDP